MKCCAKGDPIKARRSGFDWEKEEGASGYEVFAARRPHVQVVFLHSRGNGMEQASSDVGTRVREYGSFQSLHIFPIPFQFQSVTGGCVFIFPRPENRGCFPVWKKYAGKQVEVSRNALLGYSKRFHGAEGFSSVSRKTPQFRKVEPASIYLHIKAKH